MSSKASDLIAKSSSLTNFPEYATATGGCARHVLERGTHIESHITRRRETKRGAPGINDGVLAQAIGSSGSAFIRDAAEAKPDNKFGSRQAFVRATHLQQIAQERELQTLANERDDATRSERFSRFVHKRHAEERKEIARKEYKKRHENDHIEKSVLTASGLDIHKRVYHYAKWHKCPHGRSNSFVRDTPELSLYCRCDESKFFQNPPGVQCEYCGWSKTLMSLSPCHCSAIYCTRCRRFSYNYEVEQCFDKHSGSRTIEIERDGPYVSAVVNHDFSALLKKQVISPKTPSLTLKEFLSPTPPKVKTFADMVTRTTKPEGGVASSISSTTSAGFESIKKKVMEFKDAAVKKLKESKKKAIEYGMKFVFVQKLVSLFDAAIYYVRVFCDYIWALNPIMLLRIWYSRDSKIILLASLIEAFSIMKSAEEHAIMKFQLFIKEYEVKEARKMIIRRDAPSFGCLSSVFYYLAKDRKLSDREFEVYALDSGLIGAKYEHLPDSSDEMRTVETEEEAFGSICDMFCSLLKTAPRKFANGAKLLSLVFKEYMPLLMGIKVLGDLSNMSAKFVDKLMQVITGSIKDNREWLLHMTTTKGNPISDLIRDYVVYSTKSMNASFQENGESATVLRSRLYTNMSLCDAFVHEQGRMGAAWLDLRLKINNALSVPPRPEAREFEPTCLVMSGAAGAGKSTLWMAIVAQDVLTPDELKDRPNILKRITDKTFTWNSSSEYQPGMADKPVILFDDFQQNKEVVDEALALIHLCTNAPYPVNSANIVGPEIKGMMAQPDIVVVNTNLPVTVAGQGLASPNALKRRYDLEFEMLKRFDPTKPEEHIVKVARSNRYANLANVTMSLADARNLFHMTHMAKRKQFKKTKEMVTKFITTDIVPEMFTETKLQGNQVPQNLWQGNEDYRKDFEEFVLKPYNERHARQSELVSIGGDEFEDAMDAIRTIPTTQEGDMAMDFIAACVENMLFGATFAAPVAIGIAVAKATLNISDSLYLLCFGRGKSYRQFFGEIFGNLFKTAVTALISGAAMYAVYSYLTPQPESGTSRTAKARSVVSTPESGTLGEALTTRVHQATGTIMIKETGQTTNCLFIGGTFVLIPRHLILDERGFYLENKTLEIRKSTWKDVVREVPYDQKCVRFMKGNVNQYSDGHNYREDVCLYKLPTEIFSSEKRLTQHFWSGNHSLLNYTVTQHDWIHSWQPNGTFRISQGTVTHDYIRTFRVEQNVKTYHVFAEATYVGRPMSCGSAITLERQDQPIVGVHVAHSMTGASCFHFVTRKALEDAMAFDIVVDIDENFIPTMDSVSHSGTILRESLPKFSVIMPVGEIAANPVWSPKKTSLSPSAIHEFRGPVETFPAALHCNDSRINPEYRTPTAFWKKLMVGYQSTRKFFPLSDLEPAYQSLVEETKSMMKKTRVPMRTLNMNETINGLTYVEANTSMDKTTSMGWPYAQRGMNKKKALLDTGDKQDNQPIFVPTTEIANDYLTAEIKIKSGVVPFLPFSLTLKDERLKWAKIVEPRTRIFACANMIHYMLCRKYFYAYLMMNAQLPIRENFCAPTMDRISLDWHDLSIHMLEVNDEGFDFDFSNWDRTLQHAVIYYAVRIMLLPVASEMTALEQDTLVEMIASPYMIFGSTVLRSNGVLMSGSLITFMLNCLCNELIHRAAYRRIMSVDRPDIASYTYYKEYTRGIRGGDDTITTVHPYVIEHFNGLTVAEYFMECGMLVTASSKNEEIVAYKKYKDLLFLKNKTYLLRGMYLPLPDFTSLLESMRYVRLGNTQDIISATRANIECALRGFFFHGEWTYDQIRSEIIEFCPEIIPLSTYDELNAVWRKYYRFPGAHADFATDAIQDSLIQSQPKAHHLLSEARENERNYTMKEILPTHKTIYETGMLGEAMDKAQIEADIVATVEATDPTPPVPSKEISNSDDSVEKREVKRVGATVQDSTDVKMMPIKTGGINIHSKNDRAQQYLNDVDWDLQKLAHKFTYVDEIEWTSSDAPGTILKSYQIPKDILVTPAQKAPFDVTRFWKCSNVLLKLVVKASPFYAGSLGLGFTPLYATPNVKRMVNMGALIQKVSQDSGLESIIPFRYFTGYLDATTEQLGTYSIFVISPLATGPGNPTNITMSLYAAIENNEFKLPDVIPSTEYYSRKFDKPAVIVTMPESGKQAKSVVCDINDDVHMMEKTMLCAGVGFVGRPSVPHFQDAPDDLIQLLKRWTFAGRIEINSAPLTTTKINLAIQNLTEIACMSVDQMYGMYRGSINVRVVMISGQTGQKAYITLNPFENMDDVVFPTNQGFQYFDNETPAQITIPWLQRTFTYLTPFYASTINPIPGELVINLDTYTTTGPVFFEVHVCVGDDFHMGVYMGAPPFLFVPHTPLIYTTSAAPLSVSPDPGLISRFTKPESGVIQFLQRALETTIPIAQEASELMSMLDAMMITEQPTPIQWRRIPYSVACDNLQNTERMLTTNHNGMSLPDKDCFGVTQAETSIHNLITNTKTWLTNATWSATAPVGTQIYSAYTGPEPPNALPGFMTSVIPSSFGYWTGSTVYIFDIIATEMHRGQLLFVFNTITDDVTYNDATQTYFCTYDLSKGRGTIALSLPYLSPRPYTRTSQDTSFSADRHTGRLQVFVQNPLRATGAVADNVDIVVYKAFGQDFQLGVYGATN